MDSDKNANAATTRLAEALATRPRTAYAAIAALRDNGHDEIAQELSLAIVAAGGRIPDGTEFVPSDLSGAV